MDNLIKQYNYRSEITAPTKASDIQTLLNVKKDNWSTFGGIYDDCAKLDKWSNKDQKYFSSQNHRDRQKYLTKNDGESYTLEESEIETIFFSCLSDIRFTKLQVTQNSKYLKLLKENDIPRLLKNIRGLMLPKQPVLTSKVCKNIEECSITCSVRSVAL
jgi:hypothetical protein